MADSIDNAEDIIDSRDVIARIEELEGDRAALVDEIDDQQAEIDDRDGDEPPTGDIALARAELAAFDSGDDATELAALKALASQGEDYADDWQHGATMIRESYFTEYAEELVRDIGDMPAKIPSYIAIDWQKTADNIRVDYTEIDFDGVTYLVR